MENHYRYFNRDISWLSFNYRVLLEAADESLPVYERINFISIYSSNLEEFFQVRVADLRAIAKGYRVDENGTSEEEAQEIIREITQEVNRQMETRISIYENQILPLLRTSHIYFLQDKQDVSIVHLPFIRHYFINEIFPYLQPVPVKKGSIHSFLRDNCLYMAVRMTPKEEIFREQYEYYIIKLPRKKIPRFIELPSYNGNYYIMFMEDIIKMNIDIMFPGYKIDSRYCFKVSRDADILIDDVISTRNMAQDVKRKIKQRKNGAICRFVYDRKMPDDFLSFLATAFDIQPDELIPGDKHLNLEDLNKLPNPCPHLKNNNKPHPITIKKLEKEKSVFQYIAQHDLLLFYPYQSFEHFIHFLQEAIHDPFCTEIMITQYRVAENSAIISSLIAAAHNGKKVTVFVELKARFDEENNLATSEMMKAAGINIIYSIPGLKVHSKVVLILRRDKENNLMQSYACISTGNFNEQTARIYADICLFTANNETVSDLHTLFRLLQKEEVKPEFKQLLISQFNLVPQLKALIGHEIELARSGKEGRIILKMNALQETGMINELYRASEAGVKIDLIVRGICCLIPNQPYSKNIRITRIVDSFLEHARVWYFGNGQNPRIFIGSPDWMYRNLFKRIETVCPVNDPLLKLELEDMLNIQLKGNCKTCWVDERLRNCPKGRNNIVNIRPQYAFYDYLKKQNEEKPV